MVHGSGIVVGQNEVDEKSNEITAFRPVLATLDDLTGTPITADAMHTQRDHACCVVEEHHGDYLFQVKDNQPNLIGSSGDDSRGGLLCRTRGDIQAARTH